MTRFIVLPTDAWGVATVIVLAAVAHFLVSQPALEARDEYDTLAQTIVERNQELTTARGELALLESEQERLAAIAGRARHLEPRALLNERVAAISSLAQAHELEILELQRVGETPGSEICTVALRLSGAGAFQDFVRYMHELHVKEPHVAIESLDVSGNPRASGGLVRVALDMRWHAAPTGRAEVQAKLDAR